METIRKKICFDKFLSHRNGLMPYVKKDIDDSSIYYVDSIIASGNYGSFPCDFALIDSSMKDNGLGATYRQNTELSRLRYLDVIKWYNHALNCINGGKKLKRSTTQIFEVTNTDCTSGTSSVTVTDVYVWDEINDEASIFDCVVADASLFYSVNGRYYFDTKKVRQMESLRSYYEDDFTEATKEEIAFVEKVRYFAGDDENTGVIYGENNEYIYIIEDYDLYREHEDKWNAWWSDNFELCSYYGSYDRWEKYVFDLRYLERTGFKFVYDIETYVIGKVRVPEEYAGNVLEGSKVPNAVYYTNYLDYVDWFSKNEGDLYGNKDLLDEWNKRGGENFYLFLGSIYPKYLEEITYPEYGRIVFFNYVPANIEIPFAFVNEFSNECSYKVYEYSVNYDGSLYDGTIEYERGGDNQIESALTPEFMTFEDGDIIVESKLDSFLGRDVYYLNNDVYGIFDEFQNGSKMFKCVFHNGNSDGEIIKYYSGTVTYYKNVGEDDWEELSSFDVPETYVSTTQTDRLPKTVDNAYQVVGIKEISSSVTCTRLTTQNHTGYSDDGLYKSVSSITKYKKTTIKNYSWCECIAQNNIQGIRCGDGEDIDFNHSNVYRNILLLSCVPGAVETSNNGDWYYYLVKYDNGYTGIGSGQRIDSTGSGRKVLRLPYNVGETNVSSYSGEYSDVVKYDKIIGMHSYDDYLDIEYVIGATSGESIMTTGIHYKDTYRYEPNFMENTIVDGIYEADVLCERISVEQEEGAYSEDLMLERGFIPSTITAMEIGTQWTSGSSLRAYLFTEETSDNLLEYPNINVNISYNRGNAAAWEKHFKLSECNTLTDLENYGNNYFNI